MKQESKNYLSKNCSIGKGSRLEAPVRLYGQAMLKKHVDIGRFTYINTRSTLHSGTRVGRYCSIGKNVEIGVFAHPIERLSTSPVSYNAHIHFPNQRDDFVKVKLLRKKGVTIGNDVWIGSNAIIMRGITIGDGAIIGAGAIITKDVEPYSIVTGVPGRELRKRFDPNMVKRLLAVKWWDQPQEIIATLSFDDVDDCLLKLENLQSKPKNSLPKTVTLLSEPNVGKEQKRIEQQKQTDSIESKNVSPIPKEKLDFVDLLKEKLDTTHAPQTITDFLKKNASKLYSNYDIRDPLDQIILNNKVLYIASLSQHLNNTEELPIKLEKTIITTLSTKD